MVSWLKDAVFYEIYPQSFYDTNADGIGDLNGIIEKLDYIKGLGCNAIWINPCFDSPFGDAGYDVRDYYLIAERYGTNDDAKRLFEEAHKRGMHIFLDLVPGHTSVEHKWFIESCKDEKNEFTDRYVWSDSIWEDPTPLASLRGISERSGSVGVNFFSFQPALNYGFYNCEKPWQQPMDAPGPQASLEAMKDVMRFWLSMGCDGFRVDMAHSMVKNDPESKGTIALWQNVREFLNKEYPECALISEWGEPDKAIEGGFHMDFVLHFGPSHYGDLFRGDNPYFSKNGGGDIKAFVDKYSQLIAAANKRGYVCIPSSNHDMPRIAGKLDEEEIKMAFGFILTMPGAPFVYYGDEIGMRYQEELKSLEGGYERTGSRTPMQWTQGENMGFSKASADKLYLPVDTEDGRRDVESQMASDDSIYAEVKKLIGIRNEHKAFANDSDVEFVYVEEKAYPFAYLKTSEDGSEKVMVIINPSLNDVSFETEYKLSDAFYVRGEAPLQDGNKVLVKARSIAFITVE